MVLDSGRTLVIWAISLALSWQDFQWLQIIGFILLIGGKNKRISTRIQINSRVSLGMGTYNGVWLGIYRRYYPKQPDQSSLLPSYGETDPETSFGNSMNNKNYDSYKKSDKGSVNG